EASQRHPQRRRWICRPSASFVLDGALATRVPAWEGKRKQLESKYLGDSLGNLDPRGAAMMAVRTAIMAAWSRLGLPLTKMPVHRRGWDFEDAGGLQFVAATLFESRLDELAGGLINRGADLDCNGRRVGARLRFARTPAHRGREREVRDRVLCSER